MNKQKLYLICAVWFVLLTIPLVLSGFAAPDPITGAEEPEGFGANVTGGYGQTVAEVDTWAEYTSAVNTSNRYIKFTGDITAGGNCLSSADNITIDGQGYTLWGTATPSSRGQRPMELYGQNIVIKDIHVRVSGDNIAFKSPADGILVSHVSTTGSYDDGLSISYGTVNVTVQYCLFMGCTRSCFIKYNAPENISFHHNWIKGHYMRGPLVSTAYYVDVRNQLIEDWWSWGGPRFEKYATGNCINSTFVLTGATPGGTDNTCYVYQDGGPAYFSGNAFRGCVGRADNSPSEIDCPYVTTESAAAAETNVRANAGCLPRDGIDQAYIDTASGWGPVDESHPWVIGPEDVGPTCIVTGPDSPTTDSPIEFTINFSESVTGLTAAEITVTNGSKGSLTGSGAGPYTLPVTPTVVGNVTCQVPEDAAQNGQSQGNHVSNTCAVIYEDADGPTCAVTGPSSPTNGSPINFTINFSASVTGLTAAEITVTNGSKGSLTGSGSGPYTLPVTPSAQGAVTCQVPPGVAQDGGGHGNRSSNLLSITYDSAAPTATVSGPASPTNQSPIVFTVTFSESVTGLTAGEITVTNGSKGTLTGSGSGPYSLPVTPSSQGAVTCQVPASSAQDAAGNNNTVSNNKSITYDSVGPTATVTGPGSPTATSPIVFTINFSASVTGLTAAEVTVTNGSKGTLTGSGAGPYSLPVTPTQAGEVTCQVPADAAEDGASNGNSASNILSIVYVAPVEVFSETWKTRAADVSIVNNTVLTPANHNTDNTWYALLTSTAPNWVLANQVTNSFLKSRTRITSAADASFRSPLPTTLSEEDWTSYTLTWKIKLNDNYGTVGTSRVYYYLASDGGEAVGTSGAATVPSNGVGFYQLLPAAGGNSTFGGLVVTDPDGANTTTIGAASPENGKNYVWTVTFATEGANTRYKYSVTKNGAAFLSGAGTLARTVEPGTIFDRMVIRGEDCARSRIEPIDDIKVTAVPLQ